MRIQSETPQDFFFSSFLLFFFLMMSFTKAHSPRWRLINIFEYFLRLFFWWEDELCSFWAGTLFVSLHRLNNWKIFERKKRDPRWHRYQTVVWLAPSPFFFFFFFAFLYIFPFIISQCVKLRKSAVAFSPQRNLFGERLGLLESLCVFRRLTERPTPTHNANSVILFFFFFFLLWVCMCVASFYLPASHREEQRCLEKRKHILVSRLRAR